LKIFEGTIGDIKNIEPVRNKEKYHILITTQNCDVVLEADVNTYPNRKPYTCDTLKQAQDYCDMIIEGLEAHEKEIKKED